MLLILLCHILAQKILQISLVPAGKPGVRHRLRVGLRLYRAFLVPEDCAQPDAGLRHGKGQRLLRGVSHIQPGRNHSPVGECRSLLRLSRFHRHLLARIQPDLGRLVHRTSVHIHHGSAFHKYGPAVRGADHKLQLQRSAVLENSLHDGFGDAVLLIVLIGKPIIDAVSESLSVPRHRHLRLHRTSNLLQLKLRLGEHRLHAGVLRGNVDHIRGHAHSDLIGAHEHILQASVAVGVHACQLHMLRLHRAERRQLPSAGILPVSGRRFSPDLPVGADLHPVFIHAAIGLILSGVIPQAVHQDLLLQLHLDPPVLHRGGRIPGGVPSGADLAVDGQLRLLCGVGIPRRRRHGCPVIIPASVLRIQVGDILPVEFNHKILPAAVVLRLKDKVGLILAGRDKGHGGIVLGRILHILHHQGRRGVGISLQRSRGHLVAVEAQGSQLGGGAGVVGSLHPPKFNLRDAGACLLSRSRGLSGVLHRHLHERGVGGGEVVGVGPHAAVLLPYGLLRLQLDPAVLLAGLGHVNLRGLRIWIAHGAAVLGEIDHHLPKAQLGGIPERQLRLRDAQLVAGLPVAPHGGIGSAAGVVRDGGAAVPHRLQGVGLLILRQALGQPLRVLGHILTQGEGLLLDAHGGSHRHLAAQHICGSIDHHRAGGSVNALIRLIPLHREGRGEHLSVFQNRLPGRRQHRLLPHRGGGGIVEQRRDVADHVHIHAHQRAALQGAVHLEGAHLADLGLGNGLPLHRLLRGGLV